MKSQSNISLMSGLLLMTTLCACHQRPGVQAVVASDTQARQVVAISHGETVFRLQNLVMDNLITAQMSDPSPLAAERTQLASLETGLTDACQSLNEAALNSIGGHRPGMVLQLRAWVSLNECERSAVAAKDFMASARPLLRASLP